MGLIREPKGVDFVINSRALTKNEELLLSQFISEQKSKRAKKVAAKRAPRKKRTASKKKTTA